MKVTKKNIHIAFDTIKIGHLIEFTKTVSFDEIKEVAKRYNATLMQVSESSFKRIF